MIRILTFCRCLICTCTEYKSLSLQIPQQNKCMPACTLLYCMPFVTMVKILEFIPSISHVYFSLVINYFLIKHSVVKAVEDLSPAALLDAFH